MSDKPYPAGTRVVLTWAYTNVQYIGMTGTALPGVAVPGEKFWSDEEQAGWMCIRPMQEVWYDGEPEPSLSEIWALRPIEDPDKEPSEEEQRKEETA